MRKITTVANQKGGVGKTTTAFNLGAALALEHGNIILLIDLDPQANLSEYLGFEADGKPTMTQLIAEVAVNSAVAPDVVRSAVRRNEENGLDYIPSDINLANAETVMATALARETILRRILTADVTDDYDYVLIDCLPSLGILLINALTAADGMLIPVQTQKFSMDGLEALTALCRQIKAIANPSLEITGILPTMTDNTSVSKGANGGVYMKWDGAAYAEYIKHGLSLLLSSLDRQNALTLSHKDFTDFFQRAHSNITQCIPPEKIGNQSIVMYCKSDKVIFDFQRPLNNLGDREIYLTWSMAARHVRYWVAEDRMAVVAHEQKELKDYSAVIRTKLNDAMLAKEYTYRCEKAADTPNYRAEADERRAYLCAKELYIRGVKDCLSEKHRGMLETAEEFGDPTLYPSGTKSEIEKETEEKTMTAAFDLGAMLGTPAALRNEVKQIPCDMLIPYHNHKFTLYEGERLDDMVESIRANGVLIPIIVQPAVSGKYEILIGHNRWNASKLADLPTVPAIIKEGLSEDEAELYVIESNLLQRSFSEMKISEQAAVIAMRHSKMFSQGKRNDIIHELQMLEGINEETSGQIVPKSETGRTRDNIGEEYGMNGRNVARLLRIDKLVQPLKDLVDDSQLAVNAAVDLSYLSEETQNLAAEQAQDFKIDMKKAKALRSAADDNGNVDTVLAVRIISGTANIMPKPRNVKISEEVFTKYFSTDVKKEEISETSEIRRRCKTGKNEAPRPYRGA